MKILFIGDVFGSPGRKIISEKLPKIKEKLDIDFVICNAENSAHGKGISEKIFKQLIESGVDFITMGNHTWFREEAYSILEKNNNIIRPLNLKFEFPHSNIGKGTKEFLFKNISIRITNLLGSSAWFKNFQTNPFLEMEKLLFNIKKPDLHIVDFHAETTSEKYAFLWSFDGKVDAILGTHTHVPTNDAVLTDKNTAFICDVGMTGPSQGVIGGEKTSIIKKFYDPSKTFILDVEPGPRQFSSVILEYNENIKKVVSIDPLIIKEGFLKCGKNFNFEE